MTGPDRHQQVGSKLSWGSVPFSVSALEARLTRGCLARHLPSSGFFTLLTVFFLQNLPALFHAVNAHGVLPSGLFPFAEPSNPFGFGAFLTFCSNRESHCVQCSTRQSLASKALLPTKIRYFQTQIEPRSESRCPPGILPSRDFALDTARHLRSRSPLELHYRPAKTNKVQCRMSGATPQGLDSIEIG